MAYFRPSEPPPPEILVPQFEAAIRSLVRRFRTHPYAFYTETDMHCYLYHRLYAGGLVNGLYRTQDGHDTILLHKEYPTVARYQRLEDGRLEETEQGRRRGRSTSPSGTLAILLSGNTASRRCSVPPSSL